MDAEKIFVTKYKINGIDPVPEWFDKISNKTNEVDVMVDGNKVKALDIRLEG